MIYSREEKMENSRFKFRVWDKQDECYAYSNNSDVDLLYIETDGNLTYGVYSNDDEDMSYIPESEVIIEQCTGLKDKNGQLIYEGDILDNISIDEQYEVRWDEDTARFCCITDNEIYDFDNFDVTAFEVIGNIHENKELLK